MVKQGIVLKSCSQSSAAGNCINTWNVYKLFILCVIVWVCNCSYYITFPVLIYYLRSHRWTETSTEEASKGSVSLHRNLTCSSFFVLWNFESSVVECQLRGISPQTGTTWLFVFATYMQSRDRGFRGFHFRRGDLHISNIL